MASFRELLAKTKAQIREIDTADGRRAASPRPAPFLDVREPDEYEQGAHPRRGAHPPWPPREPGREPSIPDRDTPIVVYCAGGTRSAFAAKTLERARLHRRRLDGRRLRPVEERGPRRGSRPRRSRPSSATATSATSSCPRSARRASRSCSSRKVLLLGAGGLGSPAALYLAAAGVGTLGIVDMDVVDASNLQRQILHNMDRIGERKVDSAKKTLTALNPDVDVVTYDVRLGADNILDIIDGYDVIVDGTDNFPTRYLLNDASLLKRIPVVHGSIFRFEGQVTVFKPVRRARATAACCPSRRRRSSRRRARRPACSACCPASSARSRRSRRSSCCSTSATRSSAGCSRTTRSSERSARSRCGATPTCPACGENAGADRDRRVRRALHAPPAAPASRASVCVNVVA